MLSIEELEDLPLPDPLPPVIESKHQQINSLRESLAEYASRKGAAIPIKVNDSGKTLNIYKLFKDIFYQWDFDYYFRSPDSQDRFVGYWNTAVRRTIFHEEMREDVWSGIIQTEISRLQAKHSQMKARTDVWEVPMNGIMSAHIKEEYKVCSITHKHTDAQFEEYLEKLQEQKDLVPELSTQWVNWYENPYLTYSAFRSLPDINPKPNPYNPNDPYGRNKVPIQTDGGGGA